MKALFATMLLIVSVAPMRANAQWFTVLPVERDARVEASERMAAFSAVQSARVLGPSARFEAVGQLVHRLPDDQHELANCLEVDCAARLARGAGLDAVLVVAVWPNEDGRAASVAVTLVQPDGVIHEADAEVGDGGVAQAATSAVVAAARRRNMGDGVELRVNSAPEGALVLVDGTEVGVTPYLGAHEAGEHALEVRLHGASESRDVVLEEDPVEINVALSVVGGGETPAPNDDGTGRSFGSMLIPIGLAVLGVAGIVASVAGAAQETICERGGAAGSCTRGNEGAVLAWGIGGAALIVTAAILWFVLDDSEDGNSAQLGIGPTGVALNVPIDL